MNTFRTRPFAYSVCLGIVLTSGCTLVPALASAQILSVPYPQPSTNGALHYNRAMLELSLVPIADREYLAKPIWEAFGNLSKEEIQRVDAKLLHDCRHALRTALFGAKQSHAEFGIDYSDYGNGAVLPHAQPMLQLGRLITLAGIGAQIDGEWEKSAILFFQGMRLGRHMAEQPSLIETYAAIEILENNYYALAFWASKCPDQKLVKQAFVRFELGSRTMVQPVLALAYEASISKYQVERLKSAFPDGPWSDMLLESLGEFVVAGSREEHIAKAKKLCVERGCPAGVFEDRTAFLTFADKLADLHSSYLRDSAVCMGLPPRMRVKRAKSLMDAYQPRFRETGNQDMLDIKQLSGFLATHEAEQAMVRVALAVACSRNEQGFPKSLEGVADLFVGDVPKSPYDGSELEYQLINDGKDFSLVVPEVTIEGVKFSRVDFSSVREGS